MTDTDPIFGFYGKLPARGDFVRAGLPRGFTDPWDDWLRVVIAGSQGLMGGAWLPAYLEAPVWRFALPTGLCGALPAVGLILPSVDKAGRYFPLTFAALCDADDGIDAWLDACEDAGLAALEQDAAPEAIGEMLDRAKTALRQRDRPPGLPAESIWWTDGSPRVPASRLTLRGLPDVSTYTSMLGGTSMLVGGADTDPTPAETGPREEASWESPS